MFSSINADTCSSFLSPSSTKWFMCLIYYKTLLVSQIIFTVSGIKVVDPRPTPNCKVRLKAMLKGFRNQLRFWLRTTWRASQKRPAQLTVTRDEYCFHWFLKLFLQPLCTSLLCRYSKSWELRRVRRQGWAQCSWWGTAPQGLGRAGTAGSCWQGLSTLPGKMEQCLKIGLFTN